MLHVLVFIGRRLVTLVTTLLIASVAIFGALVVAPGDPAVMLAGGNVPNPETLARIRAQYHLDDPFWSQYWHWLSGILSGDLGTSVVFRTDVGHLIASRVVNTLTLVAYAAAVILVFGIGLGILAAIRGRAVNTAVTTGTTVALGVPPFVMAVVLIWLFATQLAWFPVYGSGSGLMDKLWHLTLPAVALGFTFIAYVSRITRSAVTAELHAEHVDTARGRGLPDRLVIRRHVLRNAGAPILTVSGLVIAGLFAGTAVVEQAFSINGIGSLLIESAAKQDLAVVQVVAMFMVAAFVFVNTLVDIITAVLDPRITAQGADL